MNDAPVEQAPAVAPPTRTDDQILPSRKWVPIGKNTLDITPTNDNNPYVALPSSDTVIEYVNALGYPSKLRNMSEIPVNALYQPWRAILSMINICLTSKTIGYDRPRHPEHPTTVNTKSKLPNINNTWMLNMARQRNEEQQSLLKLPRLLNPRQLRPQNPLVTRHPSSPILNHPNLNQHPLNHPKLFQKRNENWLRKLLMNPHQQKDQRGPARPVEIKEPDFERIQPLPDVQGKRKEKSGSNLGDAADSQPQSSHVDHVGPNLEHMDLEATDASTRQNPKEIDEEFTTTTYPKFFMKKQQEEEPGKTNAEAEVQLMVSVPIHQDTSLVPPMTTPVIDLMTLQSGSLLPTSTSTTTTSIITTTTSLPSPPQQSIADPILVKCIDKHGSWLYKLENLNIPYKVSKAVDEIVTDAVDWAISGRSSQEEKKKRRDLLRTPSGSPPSQPPPPLPPAGASGAPGSEAPSSSKSVASAPQSIAWNTSDTRYELAGIFGTQELSRTNSLIQDDFILDEQVHLSDDEYFRNDHLPKADSRKNWWKPLPKEERSVTLIPAWTIPSSNVSYVENNWATAFVSAYETPAENSLLAKTGDMTNFLNWYCRQVNKIELTQAYLEGKAYEVVKSFYPDVIHLQFQMEEYFGYLRYGSKGSSLVLSISKIKAASYPDFGLKLLMPEQMWIDEVCTYDISAKYGISHWWFNRQKFYIDRYDSPSRRKEVKSHMRILSVVRIKAYSRYGYDYLSEIVLRRADLQEYTIAKKDFKNLYPSDFEDLNLLLLQGHLDHLLGSDKWMLSTTVKLWTRNLVIRQ
nr:hypothetical protein [Tanacetum cinerariifolium]